MTMRTTILAAGALIAAGAATVPSAQASNVNLGLHFDTPQASIQYVHRKGGYEKPRYRRHLLTPRQVRRVLRHRGFHRIRFLDRSGRVYVAKAVSRNGSLYRLRVSAYNGRIIAQRRIGGPRRHYRHRRFDRGNGFYFHWQWR